MESGSKWIYRRQANDGIIFDQPECTLKLLFLFVYTVYIDCMMMCIRQLYDCQIKWAIFTWLRPLEICRPYNFADNACAMAMSLYIYLSVCVCSRQFSTIIGKLFASAEPFSKWINVLQLQLVAPRQLYSSIPKLKTKIIRSWSRVNRTIWKCKRDATSRVEREQE